jgi:hypothetical protein
MKQKAILHVRTSSSKSSEILHSVFLETTFIECSDDIFAHRFTKTNSETYWYVQELLEKFSSKYEIELQLDYEPINFIDYEDTYLWGLTTSGYLDQVEFE